MSSMTKELPLPSSADPVKAADVKKFDKVEDGKFYRVTFQLGPKRSFGAAIPSQTWKETKDQNGGPSSWNPVYRVYEQILESSQANGLVQESNDWQAANIRQKIEGNINRMLVVLDIKEMKNYVPKTFNFNSIMAGSHIIQAMIDSAVKAALAEKTAVATTGGGNK